MSGGTPDASLTAAIEAGKEREGVTSMAAARDYLRDPNRDAEGVTGGLSAGARPPVPSASEVEAPLAGTKAGGGCDDVKQGVPHPGGRTLSGQPQTSPPPAASPLWTCDGFPVCRFDGTRTDVRNHMKSCSESEAGAIYRVLAWAGAQR